jgi:hypothetical protein
VLALGARALSSRIALAHADSLDVRPLLRTSDRIHAGWPTRSLAPFAQRRPSGSWHRVGPYFTPQVTALVASLGGAVVLAIVWALGLGWAFGRWLDRGHADRMGGPRNSSGPRAISPRDRRASEMTLLAERFGARTDLVAAAHSLRLLVVTLSVPFALT